MHKEIEISTIREVAKQTIRDVRTRLERAIENAETDNRKNSFTFGTLREQMGIVYDDLIGIDKLDGLNEHADGFTKNKKELFVSRALLDRGSDEGALITDGEGKFASGYAVNEYLLPLAKAALIFLADC